MTYKCDKCKDTGWTSTVIGGVEYFAECECEKRKRARARVQRHIEESGLQKVLERFTFDTYKANTTSKKNIKAKAKRFTLDRAGSWWLITGGTGTGKTHITTAICGELIRQGKAVRYMQWRQEASEIKALVTNGEQYIRRVKQLQGAEVLYIDDLFKGSVTEADINLAYLIINDRYNSDRVTLISTELPFDKLRKVDEAIAGRIYEKTKISYNIQIGTIPNQRLKGAV
ncbi:MAG: ATP-binding protein [Prevotella sp.]|nr:ATP-binding protein [Prevotella sp.]